MNMQVDVAQFLSSSAQLDASATAVTEGERSLTYGALDEAANRVAAALQAAGLSRGDRVGLSAPNIIEFVVAYFAILKAGCVVVPFNILFKAAEIAHVLRDSGAVAVIAYAGSPLAPLAQEVQDALANAPDCTHCWIIGDSGLSAPKFETLTQSQARLIPLPAPGPNDPAAILYTSGTTGRPKGAVLSHGNLVFAGLINAQAMGFTALDRALVPLPLFHVFGQVVFMLGALQARTRIDLMPRFEPTLAITEMARRSTTIFGGAPTMYSAIAAAAERADPADIATIRGSLRRCVSGAASLPGPVLRRFEAIFETTILEGYGLTEASPSVAFARPDLPRKIGSVGRPIWGIEVRLVDGDDADVAEGERGELICRGPGIFQGYHGNLEASSEALRGGWLRTGDIALRDADGDLFIVDRVKDIVIRGGYNVYPGEVEAVLLEHPNVDQCAVVGRPDLHYGEEVVAFVVRRAGHETSEAELIAWAKARLAGYKYPRSIIWRDELPRNATGKTLKTVLRSAFSPMED